MSNTEPRDALTMEDTPMPPVRMEDTPMPPDKTGDTPTPAGKTGESPMPADTKAANEPVRLDGLAVGVDLLDAVLVFHLSDAHVQALWVRPESGLRAEEVVTSLRDLYRIGHFAAKRLATGGPARPSPGDAGNPPPLLTLELHHRTVVLRRIRSHVVAGIFDAAMPLGMARLIADRLAAAIGPELPLEVDPADASRTRAVGHDGGRPPSPGAAAPRGHDTSQDRGSIPELVVTPAIVSVEPKTEPATLTTALGVGPIGREGGRPGQDAGRRPGTTEETGPRTLSFGSALPRRSRPPPPPAEMDRVSRLLAYLEAHAPEPHVVRERLALRAGLTLAALARPESLGAEAVVLMETAVQDILGIDRAELRRIA